MYAYMLYIYICIYHSRVCRIGIFLLTCALKAHIHILSYYQHVYHIYIYMLVYARIRFKQTTLTSFHASLIRVYWYIDIIPIVLQIKCIYTHVQTQQSEYHDEYNQNPGYLKINLQKISVKSTIIYIYIYLSIYNHRLHEIRTI